MRNNFRLKFWVSNRTFRFVYEVLFKFFKPGSIVLNYCDTDSLCISFTESLTPVDDSRESQLRSTFENCLIEESRDQFYQIWKDWFVTEETIEDEKKPGKLKS